jgi:DNA topoisomerase-1
MMAKKRSTSTATKRTKKPAVAPVKSAKGKLVIVESPAKARTVSKILSRGYSVKASVGHVRDLPSKWLGVDLKRDFTPKYEVPKEKTAVVNEIKEVAKSVSTVYLATDPDREGEAISWHLVQAARLTSMPLMRVVFHEITPEAVTEAFRHPREIDMNLVNAQQARRILDRLVGYKISPLLCQRIRRGLSAGRVQSVALRMVVDREREITGFIPEEYWSIDANLQKVDNKGSFTATLAGFADGSKIEIESEKEAAGIVSELESASYKVTEVTKKDAVRQSAPPFTTSTLQQEGWRKLRLSAERTMAIAQQLYEGLPIGEEGSVGLITYMRTDSVRVSHSAIAETRAYIKEKYGSKFVPARSRTFRKKAKGAQEAHEAIRPTSTMREPQAIKAYLNRDQLRLYDLIWKRMVSSQMSPAVLDTTTVDVEAKCKKAKKGKRPYLLRATSSIIKFPGFTALYSEGKDETEEEGGKKPLPELAVNEPLTLIELFPEQHFTQPPNRYTQATLVKALEERGIGRPSTYAPILGTIRERGYVTQDGGRFIPTELGMLVNDLLYEHFSDIVDLGFTARMEKGLDQIAQGEQEWVPFLRGFYSPFEKNLQTAREQILKVKIPDEPTDEVCPKCGKPMVVKTGRFGKFIACTGYPQCKSTKPLKGSQTPADTTGKQRKVTKPKDEVQTPDETTDEFCPNCGKLMVTRSGRYGKFLACTGYPQCKTTKPIEEPQVQDEPTDEKCPKCGNPMVIKNGRYGRFIACSNYPECKTSKPATVKIGVTCPQCGGDLVELRSRKGRTFYGCSGYPECDFSSKDRPIPSQCPDCGGLMVARGKNMAKCTVCEFNCKLEDLQKETARA